MTVSAQAEGAGISILDGDQLRIIVRAISAATYRLIANIVLSDGTRTSRSIDLNYTAADRSQQFATTTGLSKGVLTSAAVRVVSGIVPSGPGEAYVICFLDRAGDQTATLISGYFYRGQNLGYPGILKDSQDGPGRIYTIATADPAAGSEVPVTAVPTNAKWKLKGFSVQLVQGITQTPLPTLRIRSAGATIAAQMPITAATLLASTTAQLTWGKGLTQISNAAVPADEFFTAPIPDLEMLETDDVGTITDGIGANTNYGPALLTIEEWIRCAT